MKSLTIAAMLWEERSAVLLKKEFGQRAFRTGEAYLALRRHSRVRGGYSLGSIHHLLYSLCKNGKLVRFGRGLYAFPSASRLAKMRLVEGVGVSDTLVVDLVPGALLDATRALREKGVDFMATGPSVLAKYHHYFARRLLHLIYVVKGSGELAVGALKGKRYVTLLNPQLRDIELALDSFPDADLFIVREFSDLDGNVDGKALLERALVDSYFETTRQRIPFSEEEVARIFASVARNEPISVTKLTRFASRRGIAAEIVAVAKVMGLPAGRGPHSSPASARHAARFISRLEEAVG